MLQGGKSTRRPYVILMANAQPHFLQREPDGPLESVSTEEIASLVVAHAFHDGIAYFSNCPDCLLAREAGLYPNWFPLQADDAPVQTLP